MHKAIALLAITLASTTALADPTVFGMELGKTTESELKAQYNVKHSGTNKYSNGNMYSIPVGSIEFEGLEKVTTIFSEEGVLVAVLSTLPKHKFDYLRKALAGKYKLVSKKTPFVGNQLATFVDGGTEITLDAPHLSFEMSMNYITRDFMKAYQQQSEAESRQKEQSETSQL